MSSGSSTILVGSAPDSWGVWFPDDPKQSPYPRFLDGTDGRFVNLCLDTGHIGYCGGDNIAIVEQDMYPSAVDAPLPIAQPTRRYLGSCGVPSVRFT